MNKIIIIGTEPPCPRCGLLLKIIEKKVQELELKSEIKHISYTDSESEKIAKSVGLETGTAKDVAKRIKSEINKTELHKLLDSSKVVKENEYSKYNTVNWSYELDTFLRDYEKEAPRVGILMTPVLVINGEVKYSGSIPKLEKIEEWLVELKY